MATAPRSTAARSLNPPANLPIGVRAPATITDAVMSILLRGWVHRVYVHAPDPALAGRGRRRPRTHDPRRHRTRSPRAVRRHQPRSVLVSDRPSFRATRQPVLVGPARTWAHRSRVLAVRGSLVARARDRDHEHGRADDGDRG